MARRASVGVRAASTQTVAPLADPYGTPHEWDHARATGGVGTLEQLNQARRLAREKLSERDLELFNDWVLPRVRTASGGRRVTLPSRLELETAIRYLKNLDVVEL